MIEYSITICGAMNQTELKELELVQNNVLRIATESFRSTPEIRITNVIKKKKNRRHPVGKNIREAR